MLIVDAAAIRQAVDVETAIALVREALRAAADGRFTVPQRAVLDDGRALAMVAGRTDDPGVVWKVLTSVPANAGRGTPTIQGAVLWADDETGAIGAVLDGEAVTALRTAAVTALAVQLLAPRRAIALGLLGSGAQAPDQVRAVLAVRNLREVCIWSRTAGRAEALVRSLEPELRGVRVRAVQEPSDAVTGADVVVAATRAVEPLVHARDLTYGATVVAIGSYRPDMIEVDPSVFARARIVLADDVAAVLAESGDVIRAISEGVLRADEVEPLGALDADVGEEGVRVVKSVGTAVLDWAIAAAVCRGADRPGMTGGTR